MTNLILIFLAAVSAIWFGGLTKTDLRNKKPYSIIVILIGGSLLYYEFREITGSPVYNRQTAEVRPKDKNTTASKKSIYGNSTIKTVQLVLKSKQCYKGEIDGKVGNQTKTALGEFNRRNSTNINPNNLSDDDVKTISSHNSLPCSGNYYSQSPFVVKRNCRIFNGIEDCD